MPTIAFTTANYVARETGWAMHGWAHGDRATQDHFRPLETYAERLDEILSRVRALGFEALDLWGAHLGTEWATEEHAAIARETLERHGLRLAGYATWVTPDNIERACELARAIGTDVIAAGFSGEPEALVPSLREHGVRLAVENHPEKTPAEVLAKIERGGGAFGTTVDTGWWGTQGYDARAGDLRARRAHRPRPPEGRPCRRRAARHVRLGRGRRRHRGLRDGSSSGSATTATSRSSTSPRTTTRATRSSSSAAASKPGSRERRSRRVRQHRRPLRAEDRGARSVAARRGHRPRRGAGGGARGCIRRDAVRLARRAARRRRASTSSST